MLISRGAQYWQTEISKTVVSRESFCFFVSIFETVRKTNKLKRQITKERKYNRENGALGAKNICLFAVYYFSDSVWTCTPVFLDEKASQEQNFAKMVRTG